MVVMLVVRVIRGSVSVQHCVVALAVGCRSKASRRLRLWYLNLRLRRRDGSGWVAVVICTRICDIVLRQLMRAGKVFSRRAGGGTRAYGKARRTVDMED